MLKTFGIEFSDKLYLVWQGIAALATLLIFYELLLRIGATRMRALLVAICLACSAQFLFNALDADSRWQTPMPAGEHVATAWIPANMLNEGFTSVDVGVFSAPGTKFTAHSSESNAISFYVYDPGEGDSARGLFTGRLRGVVRPLLEWTYEER